MTFVVRGELVDRMPSIVEVAASMPSNDVGREARMGRPHRVTQDADYRSEKVGGRVVPSRLLKDPTLGIGFV